MDLPSAATALLSLVALGSASAGDLWLRNENGVILYLVAKPQGLVLNLGSDAVLIQMNR